MLNFERTPPDQSMFGNLRRKRSSSSLVVHRSLPVPIPMPARLEDIPTGVPAYARDFPTGTVPDTPGPLQMAFERDIEQCDTDLDLSLVRPHSLVAMKPLPTPMPGTNLGFENDNMIGVPLSRIEQGASLSELTSEPSSYFTIPVSNESTSPGLHSTDSNTEQRLVIAAQEAYLINTMPGKRASISDIVAEAAKTGMHVSHTERCDSMLTRCTHRDEKAHHTNVAGGGRYVCDGCQFNERASMGQGSSPIGIEHIVFDEELEDIPAGQPSAHQKFVLRKTQAQMNLQEQATASNLGAFPILDNEPRPTQCSWGTHGSLYDGNGYGDTSSSSSARPSTSSTAPKVGLIPIIETGFTADSLAE
jgi:hypothetical protein